jgi:hypothetical protein
MAHIPAHKMPAATNTDANSPDGTSPAPRNRQTPLINHQ